MKTTKLITFLAGAFLAALSVNAQTFTNLNFESATLSPTTPNQTTVYVPIGSALPGWTGYIGANQQTQATQNAFGHGLAEIDIFGPNYPAAGYPPNAFNPGTIHGSYSVLLQAGADPAMPGVPTSVPASIEQTGFVPLGAQSLEFKAWVLPYSEFSVSFDGNNLPPVVLGGGANYTLYGVDISSYDGQTGTLEFSTYQTQHAGWLGLDDIAFSTTSVAPEPSIVALTAIGGLLFAARKYFALR